MRPRFKVMLRWGQPSWVLKSSHVRAYLTRLGGHLAPVTFTVASGPRREERHVQPYAIAPWAVKRERLPQGTPALLRALRGDFFCCPFGANVVRYQGKHYPPHGETANERWTLQRLDQHAPLDRRGNSPGCVTLHASLSMSVREGRVDKYLTLVDGHTAVYSRHVLTGIQGPMSLGHHALLKFPVKRGSGVISTSPFVYAQVLPTPFEIPEQGYQSLEPGAVFRTLKRVPSISPGRGDYADLTRFPARKGFDDLVLLATDSRLRFAWSAVTFPHKGYVWFALKDPRVLRHTILWMSNGGRCYAPWNGRHVRVIGLEDVTAYFHYGLAESSRRNPINGLGFPTTLTLDRYRPTSVHYIMGVAPAPPGFDQVACIEPSSGGIDLVSPRGLRVHAALDLSFLRTGAIA